MKDLEPLRLLRPAGPEATGGNRHRRRTLNCRAPWSGSAAVAWSLKICQEVHVYNAHTFRFRSGRISAGLGRIAYVFWTSQCFQGLECGSSPTSGTVFPQVRSVFCT